MAFVYQKELPEKYTVDVFVAGGGAAGVAAAIAAARQGKSVFLAEGAGAFGGLGTTGFVPAFAPFDDGEHVLAAGVGYEIRKTVSKSVPLGTYWTPIDAEELKRAYDAAVTSEKGIAFSFFTTVCDVAVTDGHIDYAVCTAKSGMFAVKAKIFIDCTGDGCLCAMGGGDYEFGDDGQVMPGTLCSLWSGVDWPRVKGAPNAQIEKAYADGVLTYEDRHLPGMFHLPNGLGGGNIGHLFNIDPTDEKNLSDAMIWGRKSILEYERYFKEYLTGYEKMTLCATAPVPGVRESRRVVCDYMLNVDDFLRRAVFDDEIGRYCYPVDIHVQNTDKEEYARFTAEYEKNLRYKKGESYGIPYASLVAKSFSNLLVAGRCIGTDRKMQASVRVMPGCFITGQAAGAAAALAADSGEVRNVKHAALSSALKKLGAYLPNA